MRLWVLYFRHQTGSDSFSLSLSLTVAIGWFQNPRHPHNCCLAQSHRSNAAPQTCQRWLISTFNKRLQNTDPKAAAKHIKHLFIIFYPHVRLWIYQFQQIRPSMHAPPLRRSFCCTNIIKFTLTRSVVCWLNIRNLEIRTTEISAATWSPCFVHASERI